VGAGLSNSFAGKGFMADTFFQQPPNDPMRYSRTLGNGEPNPSYDPNMPGLLPHDLDKYEKAGAALNVRLGMEVEFAPMLKAAMNSQSGYDILWDPVIAPILRYHVIVGYDPERGIAGNYLRVSRYP
jgi:hypothetical protein